VTLIPAEVFSKRLEITPQPQVGVTGNINTQDAVTSTEILSCSKLLANLRFILNIESRST
jgi:hypothetical protein